MICCTWMLVQKSPVNSACTRSTSPNMYTFESCYSAISNKKRSQGCVLSPYLFNIYTEFIFRETNDFPGINIGGRNVNNIRYADDTVLLSENEDSLQNLLKAVKENSSKMGLNMNVGKTKTMVMSRDQGTDVKIRVDDKTLEQVQSFKYLGQLVTPNGKNDSEIKSRIEIAKSRFCQMKSIFTSPSISVKTKIRLLKCYIHSVLLYGVETWTLNKELERRLSAFEMWTFRRIGRISWERKMTNEDVCSLLKVQPELLNTVKKRKLQYFGHTVRHNSLCKSILEGKVEGRRGRGRPPRKWMDDIKEWCQDKLANYKV